MLKYRFTTDTWILTVPRQKSNDVLEMFNAFHPKMHYGNGGAED